MTSNVTRSTRSICHSLVGFNQQPASLSVWVSSFDEMTRLCSRAKGVRHCSSERRDAEAHVHKPSRASLEVVATKLTALEDTLFVYLQPVERAVLCSNQCPQLRPLV
jgi:hypothetical protein